MAGEGRADGRVRTLHPAAVPASGPATELLYSRLTDADIEATAARIEERYRAAWVAADEAERKTLALAFGLHYEVPGVAERTGLSRVMPPHHIHSMTQGVVAETGGSYYYADMVLEALEASGVNLAGGDQVLDFSCSSGRVVRVLAAALPDVSWHGCDPNVEAIEWAQGHLPQVRAFVAKTSPPLPFDDGALAAAFAISVWSHYSAPAALQWLTEMHRVIRPGGHLVFTAHGLQSCVWFNANPDQGLRDQLGAGWVGETARRLQDQGHCFWQMFGTHGDWTVVSPEWGISFLTPEWLLEHVSPDWALTLYRIGRAQWNQDVFVLERR